MKEHIELIGRSRLIITHKLQAIKAHELPRIDFETMRADICQSYLRRFDSWMRGEIMTHDS
jgi:hypothetical protein